MIVGTRDPFGLRRIVYHPRNETSASTIAQLLQATGQPAGEPDTAAIQGLLSGDRLTGRTVLRDVLAVPPDHALVRTPQGLDARPMPAEPHTGGDLADALRKSLQNALDSGKRVALALSGGLDSALLLALLHELGARDVPVYILSTGLPDYCEREPALALAMQMHATVKLVHVVEADFVDALARTVRHVEEPLFNLHPVAKLLLADALAADGIEIAITGDGADQVLRRDRSANYLPLCKALFDSASVELWPPFLDTAVVSHLVGIPPDPDKHCLRLMGGQLGLPQRLVHGPKHGRLAPAMDLGALMEKERIHAWATTLGLPRPALDTDKERVLWTTLSLTLDHLGASNRNE